MGKHHGVAFGLFVPTLWLRPGKEPGFRLDRQHPEFSMGYPEPRNYSSPPALHAYPGFPHICCSHHPYCPLGPTFVSQACPCLFCSLLERSHPPESVFLPCLSLSAKFSTLSGGPKLALCSKVNVPGSSSLFSTSNKRLELAPQSPHTARPLGFQLGWASVRNEEWARPKFGDVSWKLECC